MKAGLTITRPLRHRNYRLFFCGQSVSLIGTWLTRTATGWLVFRLTHSALMLGVVSFAGLIPVFLVTPLAGVLVDRWNKHQVLIGTQILSALQSAALAILTLSGQITITQILVLSILQGFIMAFDFPVRQSFVIQMIDDKEDLAPAIALNSTMVNLARLIGPSAAGILIVFVGEGGCFAIDAISYLAVIATLLLMTFQPRNADTAKRKHVFLEFKEGLQYAIRSPLIISVLGIFALVCFVGAPYLTLLPVIVSQRLSGDARVLGYLSAASGFGALIGTVLLGSRKQAAGLEKVIILSSFGFGIALILLGLSKGLWLSLITMFACGMGMIVLAAAANTILQTVVAEDKRGRVLSLYATAYACMAPLGSLVGGIIADHIGTTVVLEWGGLICCIGAVLLSPRLIPRT